MRTSYTSLPLCVTFCSAIPIYSIFSFPITFFSTCYGSTYQLLAYTGIGLSFLAMYGSVLTFLHPTREIVIPRAEKIRAMPCLYIISQAMPLTCRGARGV